MTVTTCVRCECALVAGDLRCPVCSALTDPSTHEVHDPFEVLQCTSCAAGIEFDPAHDTPGCPYCGAVVRRISVEELPDTVESYLPFRVKPGAARAGFERWRAGQSWFRRPKVRVLGTRPVWWVAWSVDARILVSWTFDRRDSPRAGQRAVTFDDVLLPASRGLSQEEVTALQPGYDLETGEPERQGPEDADWEVFTMPRSVARERLSATVRRLAERQIVDDNKGLAQNLRTDFLLRGLSSSTLSCPAYVTRYRYLGSERRVVTSGQDANVIAGRMPVALGRVVVVLLILLAVGWVVVSL